MTDKCFECGSTERIGTACKPCNPELHEAPACPHDAYETDSAGQPIRCSDCHEAPAEGSGEVTADSLRSVSDETMRALLSCKDVGSGRAHLASIINDLRARSSAPEAREGEPVGPDSLSAEGKFFLAVDHLTRMTWRWGESCGIDDISWDQTGDSYNETCRADHQKARRAVVDAFHAAVAERIASHPAATSADELREALEGAQRIAGRLDSHDAGMMEDEIQAIDQALEALKGLL